MKNKRVAKYYRVNEKGSIDCLLCPHSCVIPIEKTGICGVRKNIKGKLYSTNYAEITGLSYDPIEKKPLYHFYPGTNILSIGTKGCNFKCSYCQNWNISQDLGVKTSNYSAEEIVKDAIHSGSTGIAYTYSEPFVWFEYVLDCSKLAKDSGLKNVFVTNGYINPNPLEDLLEYSDAMNIDLKSFRDVTYKKVQNGKLNNVLETIQRVYERCHLEITTLIVTGVNDDINEMKDIISWISSIDRNIPWHISRYYPNYKYDAPSTDIDFMLKVYDEAVKSLNFVFCGNISGSYGRSDTICPSCKTTVISRMGYLVSIKALKEGNCGVCGCELKIQN